MIGLRMWLRSLSAMLMVLVWGCGDGASSERDSASPSDSADAAGESDSSADSADVLPQHGCEPPAGTPTWNQVVGSIVQQKCGLCHGPTPIGGAPFPLSTWQQAAQAASEGSGGSMPERIAKQVRAGSMPPPSQPPLTAAEKEALLAWADGCGPEGEGSFTPQPEPRKPDPGERPPLPEGTHNKEFRAGNFAVPLAKDTYHCTPFDLDLDGDPSTNAAMTEHAVRIEFELDKAAVVHHIVLYLDRQKKFPNKPGPCYGTPPEALFLFAWAPGGKTLQFPPGFGLPLRDGDRLILQMHYNNGAMSQGVVDNSGVRLFLAPEQPNEIGMAAFGPVAFSLPPLAESQAASQCRMPHDVTFFASMPHMHEIGKRFDSHIERADGSWENLVTVENWSFDDQPFVLTPFTVKKGERLVTRCTWQNPNAYTVFAGEATSDEMCFNFAYHYPPISKTFCDELLDEDSAFDYIPGACSPADAPIPAELPLAKGKVKLSASLGFADGPLPEPGRWALSELHMVLIQPQTMVGTVDMQKTNFQATGFLELKEDELAIDLDALGELAIESGATVPYNFSLSESGAFEYDNEGRLVMAEGGCSDSEMPFRWFRIGQPQGGALVALAGIHYALLNVTLVFETRWLPLSTE